MRDLYTRIISFPSYHRHASKYILINLNAKKSSVPLNLVNGSEYAAYQQFFADLGLRGLEEPPGAGRGKDNNVWKAEGR